MVSKSDYLTTKFSSLSNLPDFKVKSYKGLFSMLSTKFNSVKKLQCRTSKDLKKINNLMSQLLVSFCHILRSSFKIDYFFMKFGK